MKAVCRQAAALCAARGTDLGRLALQFALTMPGVASTFVGVGSVTELDANVASLTAPVDSVLLGEIKVLLAPWHNQPWTSGLPENN